MSEYSGHESFYIQTANGASTVEATQEMVDAVNNEEWWRVHYQALDQAHAKIAELESKLRKAESSQDWDHVYEHAEEQS